MAPIFFFFSFFLALGVNVDAAVPVVDFNAIFQTYATSTSATWCSACPAFGQSTCSTEFGCAGDTGGGGPCPTTACPSVFSFTGAAPSSATASPIWHINIATAGSPYRAFSYIPICTSAAPCTGTPFTFSFSFIYQPGNNPTTTFSNAQDYLKLLFWGDGNNILGVKNGMLLGVPGNGVGDLVGSTSATALGFSVPLSVNVWTSVAVTMTATVAGSPVTQLTFHVNGQQVGSTTASVGSQNSGLQFGAYVWGNSFFSLSYTNVQITAAGAAIPSAPSNPPSLPAPASSSSSSSSSPPSGSSTSTSTTTAPAGTLKPNSATPRFHFTNAFVSIVICVLAAYVTIPH